MRDRADAGMAVVQFLMVGLEVADDLFQVSGRRGVKASRSVAAASSPSTESWVLEA